MTAVDRMQILGDCEIISSYIEKCRKSHKRIDPMFLFNKGKSIMDYAYQCHCLENHRIPVCGEYKW